MKEFLLLFRGGMNFQTAPKDRVEKTMQKWREWIEQLTKEGRYEGGHRLSHTGTVMTGHEKKVTDGPYAEGKEIVGGYMAIKADDFKEATKIARDCPILENEGIVELREIIPPGA